MNISGVAEFNNFVRTKGLMNIHPAISQLVACMDDYARLCTCDPKEVKAKKINKCKELYVIFASQAHGYKAQLLGGTADNHISFYNDGRFITTITR